MAAVTFKDLALIFPIFVILAASGIFLNFLQLLCCPLAILHWQTWRKVNKLAATLHWPLLVFLTEGWGGIKLQECGELVPDDETCLVVINHRSDIDWIVGQSFGSRRLPMGGLKVIMKDSAKYVPVFGWMMYLAEFIFIKRNWDQDKQHMTSALARMATYPRPFWFVIYAEGTRFDPSKVAKSQEFSQKEFGVTFKNVLCPRTRGFVEMVRALRGHVPTVFDATMVFDREPSLLDLFTRRANTNAYIVNKTYKMSDLPLEDKALERWLIDRWAEKEALIETFLKTGKVNAPRLPTKPSPGNKAVGLWMAFHVGLFATLYVAAPGLCVTLYKGLGLAIGVLFVAVALVAKVVLARSGGAKKKK
jgi:lysophosphatidic acid acyltransferase / lysophosphatidylinositol acyltransferase